MKLDVSTFYINCNKVSYIFGVTGPALKKTNRVTKTSAQYDTSTCTQILHDSLAVELFLFTSSYAVVLEMPSPPLTGASSAQANMEYLKNIGEGVAALLSPLGRYLVSHHII